MNKTKEEILEHLESVGYAKDEQGKIVAYLYGKEIIEFNDDVPIKVGNNDFEFFVDWCENETDYGVLVGLFEDIATRAEKSKSLSEMERYIKQMDFLIDEFGLSNLVEGEKECESNDE